MKQKMKRFLIQLLIQFIHHENRKGHLRVDHENVMINIRYHDLPVSFSQMEAVEMQIKHEFNY